MSIPVETPEQAVARLEDGFSKAVRFAVEGPNGLYSGSWLAVSNKSDYYIGARHILGSMKVSLHGSGICQVALHQTQIDAMASRGLKVPPNRALVRWRRGATPIEGAVCAVSVKFPAAFFRGPAQMGKPAKPLLVFQLTNQNNAAEVGFFYSIEPMSTLEAKLGTIGTPLFFTRLDNGETVSIVAREVEFDPSVLPSPQQLAQSQLGSTDEMVGSASDKLIALLWNSPPDGGTLEMVEVGGVRLTRTGKTDQVT